MVFAGDQLFHCMKLHSVFLQGFFITKCFYKDFFITLFLLETRAAETIEERESEQWPLNFLIKPETLS